MAAAGRHSYTSAWKRRKSGPIRGDDMLTTPKPRPLLLIVALCVVALGGIAPAGAQPAPIGTVEALVGTALVTRQATGEALPLTVGAELFEARPRSHRRGCAPAAQAARRLGPDLRRSHRPDPGPGAVRARAGQPELPAARPVRHRAVRGRSPDAAVELRDAHQYRRDLGARHGVDRRGAARRHGDRGAPRRGRRCATSIPPCPARSRSDRARA